MKMSPGTYQELSNLINDLGDSTIRETLATCQDKSISYRAWSVYWLVNWNTERARQLIDTMYNTENLSDNNIETALKRILKDYLQ